MKLCHYLSVLVLGGLLSASPARAELIAHWKLDDGLSDPNSTTAVDSVAPASDGTLTNFNNPADKWGTGIAGGALEFGDWYTNSSTKGPDIDDVVSVSSSGKLAVTGAITLSAWVRYEDKDGFASTQHIAGVDRGGGAMGDAFSLKRNGGTDAVEFMVSQGANTNLAATSTLAAYTAASIAGGNDGWVHLVGVFEPDQFMRLYVNGVLDSEITEGVEGVPSAIDLSASPFNIGRLDNSDRHSFEGMIDDVQLYSGALSSSQVGLLFANPGAVVPEPATCGLLGLVLGGWGLAAYKRRR